MTAGERTFVLSRFTMRDMVECGRGLRRVCAGARTMSAAAAAAVNYLYERLVDEHGQPAAVLARLFTTERYDRLSLDQQLLVPAALKTEPGFENLRCLLLLATRGTDPAWNDISSSQGHRVIPLRDKSIFEKAPMLNRLASQFGVQLEDMIAPDPLRIRELLSQQFGVFYVPEALGSPFVPSQDNFVVPHAVRTVLGFGAILPSGAIFAVLLFLRVAVSDETAKMFQPLALSIKASLLDAAARELQAEPLAALPCIAG